MGLQPSEKTNAPNGADGKSRLNVILHGLFTWRDEGDQDIVAYLPNMGSEHAYKAGTWLAETDLDQHADLSLTGVTGGSAHFNGGNNFVLKKDVRLCDCGCEDQTVYAILRFPRPKDIQSRQVLKIPPGALVGDTGRVNTQPDGSIHNATVQVLTYDLNDGELRLGDSRATDDPLRSHPWQPVLDGQYINLHIFSEPERSPDGDHVRHAFQASMSLFVGLNLALKQPPEPVDGTNATSDIPGVHALELEDLIHRRRRLALLGRAIKQSRDLNSIWADPVPFYGDEACLGHVT